MAARESQGAQALAITFGILFFLMAALAFAFYRMRSTAVAQAADAEKRANDSSSAAASAQAEANTFKQWIGFAESDTLEALNPNFDQDKQRFGANVEEASLNYRGMLDNIWEERNKLVTNEATVKQEIKDLRDRLLAVEAEKEAQVKQAQAEMKKVSDDAAAERAKFEAQNTANNAEKDKLQGDIQAMQAENDKAIADKNAEATALKNEVGKLERSIDKLREGLPEVDEFAQPADGRIAWVNQRYGKVWIDLGSADGLRPQVTFKVAAVGNADAEAAENKGSIEVLRILEDHMAEAQVTSDDPKNPIMPGDRIYSPVWDRGRQVGFAIAGFIDFNKDRRSDLAKLKDIIAASNGRVDAAPNDEGQKEGEMKVETRYLILGEYPEGTLPSEAALRTSWGELSDEAQKFGVETIPVDEFLQLVGWQSDARSVPMGPSSRAADFPPEAVDPNTPRRAHQPAGAFKKRLPAISY